MLVPDSSLVASIQASPNHGERRGKSLDLIVLHYTGMPDGATALRRLCDPASEVSTHYFVDEDGRIVQCVAEMRRAWHAGESFWAGESDINSCSIGIEIVNPGHDFGYRDYPSAQVESVIALCRDIVARHSIRADRILAHSDVATSRKRDPGEKFPWAKLNAVGLGHWVSPHPLTPVETMMPRADSAAVRALQEQLAAYGYDIPCNGIYDEKSVATVTAFQRHFRPARVDGIADLSTRATLRDLLAARDQLLAGSRA
jgi:N-acetylmuramoyl-L-alanine amidase